MFQRTVRLAILVVCLLSLISLPSGGQAQPSTTPPATFSDLQDIHAKLGDFDRRINTVLPTVQQLAAINTLGARVRWNKFGTPASLINDSGWLATGLSGDPASVARSWVRSNRTLFRLGDQAVTDLELLHAVPLGTSGAHAVLFRQRWGSLAAVQDGMIAVGVQADKVAYASSSALGDAATPPAATLTAQEAWVAAALNATVRVSLQSISNLRSEGDWTVFDVAGLAQPQRARLRAFPIPGAGVRPVFETNVVHVTGGSATAYTALVDAQSGVVLMRQNRVQQLAAGEVGPDLRARPIAAPVVTPFSGAYTAPACGPDHTFSVAAGTTRVVVAATTAVVANDIVLQLIRVSDDTIVATADTATSPEAITYAPQGGVTAGSYTVRVCPYDGVATVPVSNYSGTFTSDDTPVPNPLPYPPKWSFFPANPPLDYSATDTRLLGCWENAVGGTPLAECDYELRNAGARTTWDYSPLLNRATNTTLGNAANTAEAWLSPLTPAEQYRPVSAERSYAPAWTNQWYASKCNPANFASLQRNDIDAAITNLFVMHNRMHDWSYFLGFTEQTYNAQTSNFGNGSVDRENDPEIGNAQAGAVDGGAPSYQGRDNANQITLQDGIPPITNMYLWQPIAAAFYPNCVDGDYDMSVIGHEYTHLISNRMVGGPDSSLTGNQAGAMGESWSDLASVEYLNSYGFVPVGNENPFAVGAYVTGNPATGIRNYAMNDNPLVYGNFGYDLACNSDLATGECTDQSEFHSDAEIWDSTNFAIRQALIAKHNATYPASDMALQKACADGKRDAELCPGNRRWIQLVFDAFLLMQPEVTFLDARDAYLAADRLRFGGAHQAELWQAFARHGMGEFASTTGSEDVDPVANYESAVTNNEAEITFNPTARDANGQPVIAKIYVGHYEARGTPLADTDPTTPLGNRAKFVPGTYAFVVQAAGYGLYRASFTLSANTAQTLSFSLPTNWASQQSGATITGNGATSGTTNVDYNLTSLIDDTENTTYARVSAPSVDQAAVVVDLGGTTARTVKVVQVSAMQRLRNSADPGGDTGGQSRFSALRQFAISACDATQTDCSVAANFRLIYTSPADAFPGRVPRPAAPDLIMRSFAVPPTQATHIKLQVLSNQCTGNLRYQGDTDADALNNTDCLSNAAAKTVRIAELEVFSSAPEPIGAPIYLPLLNR